MKFVFKGFDTTTVITITYIWTKCSCSYEFCGWV